jgi:hopanoid C-3 methylase
MNVLLIWPKAKSEVLGYGDLGAIAEPLALEYLAAVCASEGHEPALLDLRLHPDDLDATLASSAPDVVGITAFSMHVHAAVAICRRVKALLPSTNVVVGGHHATLMPEDFFDPSVDFVVRGEGTGPFKKLLRELSGKAPEGPIAGLVRNRDGQFTSDGQPSPFLVDSLPFPDRHITDRDRLRYFIDWMKPVSLLRTSVGCPYRCTFCSLWNIMDGRYYVRDTEQVVAETRAIHEDFVFLVDDEAFINGKRMATLANALQAAGCHKRYFTYCRIDTLVRLKDDVLPMWRAIGLERLFIGIDAISERELVEYNKRMLVSRIEEGLEAARELGIEIFAQFVVSPRFTRKDFQSLVRFIQHHRITYPSFTVLTPIPGTALLPNFDNIVDRQPNGRPNWELFDCQHAVTPTLLPPDEFRAEYKNLYRVFAGNADQGGRPYAHYRGAANHGA